jgi:hypothetical protein
MVEQSIEAEVCRAIQGLKVQGSERSTDLFNFAHDLGRLTCQVMPNISGIAYWNATNKDAVSNDSLGRVSVRS